MTSDDLEKATLTKATTKELEVELERRNIKARLPPPPQLDAPDFTMLRTIARDGLADAHEKGYVDKNFDHYIYETALTALYGEQIWQWLRTVER